MRTPGTIIGRRFELLGELRQGEAATVYLATDVHSGERVALTLLHPHLTTRRALRATLRRDVQAAQQLRHPHILTPAALIEQSGALGVQAPLHTGRSLREHVAAQGPLDSEALWRLGSALADALAHAHRAGVIHHDVSPDSVLINDRGEAVLDGFGLGRLAAEPREDLYALGATLAFAATGQAAPGQRTPLHRARRDLPLEWCEIVEAMRADDPAARPQGARAVALAFQERSPPPLPQRTQGALATLPATTALQLPEGDWVVLASERDADARRRGRLRRVRAGEADIESVVVGALESAGRKLLSAFSLPQTRTPEERVVRAVARAAGLPDDALEPPDRLLDRDVVLLSGVDEETARTVGRAAQEAGFLVELQQAPPDLRRSPPFVFGMLGAFLLLGVGAGWLLTVGSPAILLASMAVIVGLWFGVPHRPPLPEAAFDRELLAHLSPRYRIAAPTPPPVLADEAAGDGPVSGIQQRALAQIDELEALLRSQQVPAVVASDLQETLSALRWQAEELASKSVILQSLQAGREGEGDAAAAVEQVEARLARLQTLAQAGQDVSMAEVRQLEAALVAHQQTLAEQEEAEAELTQVAAHFLEIGATVAHCRRVLSAAASPDDGRVVLGRLREEVQQVAAVQDELAETSRRRRALAAQQQRQR